MIYMFLADGFEEVEALCPLDLLRRAGADIKTVSVNGDIRVEGAHGIPVVADLLPHQVKEVGELLIFPGGMPGSTNLDQSPFVDAKIRETEKAGGRFAAICAAPLVLGHRNLLRGRKATCFPGFEGELYGAEITGGRVVTDGNVTTAIGMGACEEFGIELVKLLYGEPKAKEILQGIHAR